MEGERFSRLLVGKINRKDKSYNKYYECKCDCGNTTVVRSDKLINGKIKSCGCHGAEVMAKRKAIAAIEGRQYTKNSYESMMSRCYNERAPGYGYYGARGISVCDRWVNGAEGKTGWVTFFSDMGTRPEGASIDRIDNKLGYSPENCRWATKQEQARNRSCVKLDELDVSYIRSSSKSHKELADELGVSRDHVKKIRQGKSWVDIETPPGAFTGEK